MRLGPVLLIAVVAWARPAAGERVVPRQAPSRIARPGAVFKPTAFSVEIRGRGRPVILIPGLGCPGSVWHSTMQQMRGYQTYALTLAGFAGKPRIAAPLIETTVVELAHYIRAHHLVHPVIIGHSLGGSIAYALAAREPGLVGPVVVVDAGVPDGAGNEAAAAAARDQWRDGSDAQFARQINEMFRPMSTRPERMAPVLAEIAKSDRRAIGDAVYELSVMTVRDLGRIRAPVLVVLADGALQDDFRRQARAIREHSVVVIPRTGHFVMLDDPRGFFAAVDDFLEAHSAIANRRTPPRNARRN